MTHCHDVECHFHYITGQCHVQMFLNNAEGHSIYIYSQLFDLVMHIIAYSKQGKGKVHSVDLEFMRELNS